MHGRCLQIQGDSVTLINEQGVFTQKFFKAPHSVCIGDIVELKEGQLILLTQNKTRSEKWRSRILDQRRIHGLKIRGVVENQIRKFFIDQDFLETRTPLLVKSPGMEPHIRPYKLQTGEFLPTSPEFAMKKLLAGGLEKIFQICSAFRYEPTSPHHHPEFTILEWYRAYAGYEEIMTDFENMVESLALSIHGKPELKFQGKTISVKTPWPRLRVRDLFLEKTQIDLVASSTIEALGGEARRLGLSVDSSDTWDDIYFKIWLDRIEPFLPSDRGVFVIRYPASQSALAVIDQDEDGSRWARRFEPYAGGLELGNAFEELTDPVEQRKRFVEDMNLREEIYGDSFPKNPIDEDFLSALEEGIPPSGGIAVGVDRLVMLFADEGDIDYIMWLPSYIETQT
jgi:lysyl-tRNA synthetase class 2